MIFKIESLSLKAKIRVLERDKLEADLSNMMELIHEIQFVGTSNESVYSYKTSEYRDDDPVNIIQDENFDPFLNASHVEDNMFEVEGVIESD
ncbi:MAG: hypothetical protein H6845_00120 [Alphaproteobacteria bacterium]|nr:MAG: hypothetical protein H6845_00120 [Alphaproteobacteria bacterium]